VGGWWLNANLGFYFGPNLFLKRGGQRECRFYTYFAKFWPISIPEFQNISSSSSMLEEPVRVREEPKDYIVNLREDKLVYSILEAN
jgi:hypothetical protein